MSDRDANSTIDFSFDNQPFAWVIIPLVIIIFFVGFIVPIFQIRRLRSRVREQYRGWPSDPVLNPTGHLVYAISQLPRRSNRWARVTTLSQEGLNELGEAPPPYDGKTDLDGTELRDLEARTRPPEYPTELEPAVTTHSPDSTPTRRFTS